MRQIIDRFGAAFDFERRHARLVKLPQILNRAEVFRVQNIRAVFVLFDGKELARTLGFFESIRAALFAQAVLPPAGVRADAEIGVAVRQIT